MRGACFPTRRERRRQGGSVMIVAVLILLVVTATALLLATSMRVEMRAAANHVEAMAAANAAEGAVRHVMAVLARTPGQMPDAADLPTEGVIVGDAAYWLIRPARDGQGGYEPGIADEAGKLHLNIATQEMLVELPGVTEAMAEALIAWRSSEEEAFELPGAGAEHYLMQDPPYLPKHGPLESVEELLLIRGWSREVLFGASMAGEAEGTSRRRLTGSVETDAGLYDFLTVYSHAVRADAINVNASDERDDLRELLESELSAERFSAVWSALGFGGGRGGGGGGGSAERFESMLGFYAASGLTAEEFDALAPRLTTDETQVSAGRVNVNTASETVLAALPGLDASDAAALVDARAGRSEAEGGLAWVVEAIGDDRLFEAGPYLTEQAYQFTVDVVAIAAGGRAFKRYRVVIDMGETSPRVVRLDDWTARGWPLAPALREALRSGVSLEEAVALHGRLSR